MSTKIDPITLEVFRNLFSSVAEEMGESLARTAHKTNTMSTPVEALEGACPFRASVTSGIEI